MMAPEVMSTKMVPAEVMATIMAAVAVVTIAVVTDADAETHPTVMVAVMMMVVAQVIGNSIRVVIRLRIVVANARQSLNSGRSRRYGGVGTDGVSVVTTPVIR